RRPVDRSGDPRGRARRFPAAPDGEGVRSALLPRVQSTPRLLARPADGSRVGIRSRGRHGNGDRARPPAALEDRARPVRAAAARDGVGRGLPVRAVTGFALAVAALTLGIGLVVTFGLTLLPTARMQLIAFALFAVLLPIWIVFFSGWAMFHMGDDVKILGVASGAASAAVGAALVIGTSLARRIERLRAASARLAAGGRDARAPETGPRELAELGRGFNEMASSIESLFDARRELVAAASHDLRTPIASITAMLEAIEDGLADSAEYLVPLQEQARRLGSLVEDLFELARIDAGSLAHELHEISLAPLVESCVRGVEAEARARNVRLERRLERAPLARCAPEQVERVLE